MGLPSFPSAGRNNFSLRKQVAVNSIVLEKLLAPRQSLGWRFCFTVLLRTRLHKSGEVRRDILLFFLYFSSGSTYLFNILVLDLHHRIDILSTHCASVLQTICTPPRHTTPMGLPSFPSAGRNNFSLRKQVAVNSIVLQDYRLYALLHAVPPPWGSHLSHPPDATTFP